MRSRSMAVAVCVSVACAAGAAGCHMRAAALQEDAAWIMARGRAQAAEYARSFDGTFADQQLASFDARRVLLERGQDWQLAERLLWLSTAVGLFASYVLYLFRRVREELYDVTADEEATDPGIRPRAGMAGAHQGRA